MSEKKETGLQYDPIKDDEKINKKIKLDEK